jgi:hypothetical protein
MLKHLFCFLLPLPLIAAINPANFNNVASEQLKLRELSRIVHTSKAGKDELRRVTIVAEVVTVRRGPDQLRGQNVVVDYTVNLSELERAKQSFRKRQGDRPGPQFMSEPEPPALDDKGEFWASLAPAGGRLGNVNRHAGAVAGIGDYKFSGKVFVPVAGQYSFQPIW